MNALPLIPVESERITDLGHHTYLIDTQMGGYEGIAAAYAILASKPTLVETGTALSAPIVEKSLESLGLCADDLAMIVVTHIHLDHAGGVGDIAARFPNAKVVVHERGARHLVDPTKLMASARRVFGQTMDTLFGELLAVDADRLVILGERDTVDLGDGRTLESFYAPGHASHHVGLVDSLTGDLFTGDAAGVYVPETADVRPATPPPDFDLDLTISSINKMIDIKPTRLLFSHFGPVTDVQTTLDRSIEELKLWVEIVDRERGPEHDIEHAIAMIRERSKERSPASFDNDIEEKFEALSSIRANVEGISRWLDQRQSSSSS